MKYKYNIISIFIELTIFSLLTGAYFYCYVREFNNIYVGFHILSMLLIFIYLIYCLISIKRLRNIISV